MTDPATIATAAASAAAQPTFFDILDKILSLGIAGLVVVLAYFGALKISDILRQSSETIDKVLKDSAQKIEDNNTRADDRMEKMIAQYAERTDRILEQNAKHMTEQREMYITNASLVKRYAELAGSLKDVITLNTQVMTQLVDRIEREVCK